MIGFFVLRVALFVPTGILRGSILRPFLYILYSDHPIQANFCQVRTENSRSYHVLPDTSQLYISFHLGSALSLTSSGFLSCSNFAVILRVNTTTGTYGSREFITWKDSNSQQLNYGCGKSAGPKHTALSNLSWLPRNEPLESFCVDQDSSFVDKLTEHSNHISTCSFSPD